MNAFSQLCSSQPHKGPHPADPTSLHAFLLCPCSLGSPLQQHGPEGIDLHGLKWMKMQVFLEGNICICALIPFQVHRLFQLLYLIQFPEEHLCHILQVRKLRQKVIASSKVTQLVSMRTGTLTPGFWLQVREPSNKYILTFIQMPGQFVYPDTQQ